MHARASRPRSGRVRWVRMASPSDLRIQLIRETLQGLVEPEIASQALFDALQKAGDEVAESDLPAFIDGPLREALAVKLDRATVHDAIEHLAHVVARTGAGGPTPALGTSRSAVKATHPGVAWHTQSTRQVAKSEGPLRLLVLSERRHLGEQLRLAIGPDRLAVTTAATADQCRAIIRDFAPDVILFDANDPPMVRPPDIARVLESTPATTMRVLWGRELRVARDVMKACDELRIGIVSLDRREGSAPLFDLLRSRAA